MDKMLWLRDDTISTAAVTKGTEHEHKEHVPYFCARVNTPESKAERAKVQSGSPLSGSPLRHDFEIASLDFSIS